MARIKYWVLFLLLFFLGRFTCEFILSETWIYVTGFIFGWIILLLTSLLNRPKAKYYLDLLDRVVEERSSQVKKG